MQQKYQHHGTSTSNSNSNSSGDRGALPPGEAMAPPLPGTGPGTGPGTNTSAYDAGRRIGKKVTAASRAIAEEEASRQRWVKELKTRIASCKVRCSHVTTCCSLHPFFAILLI